MAKKYADYRKHVESLVRDKSKMLVEGSEIDDALEDAVLLFSDMKPKIKVVEVTATGSRLYDLPSGWEVDRSDTSFRIEYPVSDTAEQVQYLRRDMTEIYETPTAQKLRFRDTPENGYLPASGEKFRVHFPIAHVLNKEDSGNTIPDRWFGAVTKLGAREVCRRMSTRFAQLADQNRDGGQADYRNKSDIFTQLAREFWKDFKQAIAPDSDDQTPALSFGTFEQTPLQREPRSLFPQDASGLDINV